MLGVGCTAFIRISAGGFFHEANEPLAVQRGVHAAQLAPDPAYPLEPRLRVLHFGVHLLFWSSERDGRKEGEGVGKQTRRALLLRPT